MGPDTRKQWVCPASLLILWMRADTERRGISL